MGIIRVKVCSNANLFRFRMLFRTTGIVHARSINPHTIPAASHPGPQKT